MNLPDSKQLIDNEVILPCAVSRRMDNGRIDIIQIFGLTEVCDEHVLTLDGCLSLLVKDDGGSAQLVAKTLRHLADVIANPPES